MTGGVCVRTTRTLFCPGSWSTALFCAAALPAARQSAAAQSDCLTLIIDSWARYGGTVELARDGCATIAKYLHRRRGFPLLGFRPPPRREFRANRARGRDNALTNLLGDDDENDDARSGGTRELHGSRRLRAESFFRLQPRQRTAGLAEPGVELRARQMQNTPERAQPRERQADGRRYARAAGAGRPRADDRDPRRHRRGTGVESRLAMAGQQRRRPDRRRWRQAAVREQRREQRHGDGSRNGLGAHR